MLCFGASAEMVSSTGHLFIYLDRLFNKSFMSPLFL